MVQVEVSYISFTVLGYWVSANELGWLTKMVYGYGGFVGLPLVTAGLASLLLPFRSYNCSCQSLNDCGVHKIPK